ncbi:hypothetical protein KBY66_06670 [Synechococcus sp. Tobar12-5m-g]|uniref:hypothetical protein n=1 Tax=unclassified Synechococcus TaxID=2626047 RepID=UPI0020CBE19E|nr:MULTISPECIES: hypothetical protein [unclassified Synechococcus]MCP9772306.1 hypothetical protein [Synechococcus sp. Tobar12-5m-g]MCP9873248.1 hypothetical protein [Synechococcus sp. Cruz CV-v-12]
MTQALSAAIATAFKLPREEQDVLASILWEEIASAEECWRDRVAGSQSVLEILAAEAIRDFDGGRIEPLDEHE